MSIIDLIDEALVGYTEHWESVDASAPPGFTVAQLQEILAAMGKPRTAIQVSGGLQQYRQNQRREGRTSFIIGCRSKGPKSEWQINSRQRDRKLKWQDKQVMEHMQHCIVEWAETIRSDWAYEIDPGNQSKMTDAIAENLQTQILAALQGATNMVQASGHEIHKWPEEAPVLSHSREEVAEV